jgi:hypothetical protein
MEHQLEIRESDLGSTLMELASGVSFARRPNPIAGDLRLSWRLPLLVMTLHLCCRNGQSSHKRLHVLNWAARTAMGQRQLLAVLEGRRRPQDVLVRTDPVLNQVIEYGLGEGLLEFPRGDRVRLTEAGRRLAREVVEAEECLDSEKHFLHQLGRDVTEDWVDGIMNVGAPAWG